jgi:hypothetical protein
MRTDNGRHIGAVHALDQEAFVTLGKTKTKTKTNGLISK